MSKNKRNIPRYKERVLLWDTLPYEVPLFFSNENFYRYITSWNISNAPEFIKNIFCEKEECWTIPMALKISHKDNWFRKLSIIHPKTQLKVANFYNAYKYIILYYTSRSNFSIRKPYKIASIQYFNDRLHKELFSQSKKWYIEEYNKEYNLYSTYYVYKKFDNLYKFFESYLFHKAEKKFNFMISLDIAKCFDSIYTHSMSWSILDKEYIKDNLPSIKGSFWDNFDQLMQRMNYNETNWVVIWPEFSRIFSEIILQKIDLNIEDKLRSNQLERWIHYEIYRYVDDFFIFFNSKENYEVIEKSISDELNTYNLHLNYEKKIIFDKPVITNITIAKNEISNFFNESYSILEDQNSPTQFKFYTNLDSRKGITKFKSIVKQYDIEYKNIINYFLIIIERTIHNLIRKYSNIAINISDKNHTQFISYLINMIEVCFFVYSSQPRVSYTIKISLILNEILWIFKDIKNKKDSNKFIELNIWNIDFIKKKIFDEIILIFKSKLNKYSYIETIYLLNNLESLWWIYKLTEKQFEELIVKPYEDDLSYFSIVSVISYIKDDCKYLRIKKDIEKVIINKLSKINKKNINRTTEAVLLLFDIVCCPYFSLTFKEKILRKFNWISRTNVKSIRDYIIKNKICFSKIGKDFNFHKEILKKKKIEVY